MGDFEELRMEKKNLPLKAWYRLTQSCWILDMASHGRMIKSKQLTKERKTNEEDQTAEEEWR